MPDWITNVHIRKLAPSQLAQDWTSALQTGLSRDSIQILKQEALNTPKATWVWKTRLLNQDIIIKARALGTLKRRLQSLLRTSHAHRQWRGSDLLKNKGFLSARPLVLANACMYNMPVEILILQHIPGPTLLEVMRDSSRGQGLALKEQHALAMAIGELLIDMCRARIWNKDIKPSNLIVTQFATKDPKLALIDSVAIHRCNWLGIDERETEQMLSDLLIEPIGSGCSPRKSLQYRVLSRLYLATAKRPRDQKTRDVIRECVMIVTDLMNAQPAKAPKINPFSPSSLTPQ